jgi:hypothetical protein
MLLFIGFLQQIIDIDIHLLQSRSRLFDVLVFGQLQSYLSSSGLGLTPQRRKKSAAGEPRFSSAIME